MSKAAKTRTRRKRRQTKQMLRHGVSAKPAHKLQSGRTGHVHTRKLKALKG